MAHRGRLNVQAHAVAGRTARSCRVRRREGHRHQNRAARGGTGDVKYHQGVQGTNTTASGGTLKVTLSHNPSHLEYVDPVVEGRTRADQTDRRGPEAKHDPSAALPILIHGDAAFPGEGVVAETLNLQGLKGYSTGGTIHIIANNQIGFTTAPKEAARPGTPPTSPRASTSRSSTSTRTILRRALRRCGWQWATARNSSAASSST